MSPPPDLPESAALWQVPQNPENKQWLQLRSKTKEMVYGLEEQERDDLAVNGAAEKSLCQRVKGVRFLASERSCNSPDGYWHKDPFVNLVPMHTSRGLPGVGVSDVTCAQCCQCAAECRTL